MQKDLLSVTIGNKIRAMRIKSGLSQEEFSYKVNTDRTYICKIENGTKNLTVKKLCQICEQCNISIKEFFSDDSFNAYFCKNEEVTEND